MKKSTRFLFLLILLNIGLVFTQTKKESTNTQEFPSEELFKLLITSVNKYRINNGIDTLDVNELLSKAADLSSKAMA
ncbi:MAG: hypothetical protein ACK452_01740, partial [Bacteroidota bacterium]